MVCNLFVIFYFLTNSVTFICLYSLGVTLQQHINSLCSKVTVYCPLKNCKEKVERSQLASHLKVCPNRDVLCNQCRKIMPFHEFKNHSAVAARLPCAGYLFCPNQCIDEKDSIRVLLQTSLDNHLKNECARSAIACGVCENVLTRHLFEYHNKQCCDMHIAILNKKIQNMKDASQV